MKRTVQMKNSIPCAHVKAAVMAEGHMPRARGMRNGLRRPKWGGWGHRTGPAVPEQVQHVAPPVEVVRRPRGWVDRVKLLWRKFYN